jgi:hypothetical protein
MSWLSKLFVIDREGINVERGRVATAVLPVPFTVASEAC